MNEASQVLQNLETAVEGFIIKDPHLTSERIRDHIGKFRLLFDVDDEAAEQLARRFENRHGVTMTLGSVLKDNEYQPWLESARKSIEPYYWERYRRLLSDKKLSNQVVATIDNVTDRVLGLLANPLAGEKWYRRGMVVGHVQSGKTANYTGLICKAADAGYKLIVVIAGIHNNLRNQTQARIDEGFVGRDSARLLSKKDDLIIGVGRYDINRRPSTFTNSVRDFNKQMATSVGVPLQNLKEPAVFVIKKNSSTLTRLLEWLKELSAGRGGKNVDAPMLLIDDEADNATINIRHGQAEASRINSQIRELLKLFSKRCYVGYTATPFANIFIDPDSTHDMYGDDLFPKNFIVSLDPPSNYFGPAKVFPSDRDSTIVRNIEDHDATLPLTHTINHHVDELPASLLIAVRTFVVAKAIRLARGQRQEHCSMLVNASRFKGIQGQIRNAIHQALEPIQSSCRLHAALHVKEALQDPEISELQKVWLQEYADCGFAWPAIQAELHEAVAPIIVTEINSGSAGKLNYSDYANGLSVIAVGGYSLSRGLTLEGLMVSFFLRNSMMYDTLMQMGRWFGYRPGYDDLCRVWMPAQARGWYTHIAESIEELRDQLRRMEQSNATPAEFGLKVRSHPDTLIVTARNKMGSSQPYTVSIGLDNMFVETAVLKHEPASLEANRNAAWALAADLEAAGKSVKTAEKVSGGWFMESVPVEAVLSFLSSFQNHPGSMITEKDPICRYIRDRQADELEHWDLFIPSISEQRADHKPLKNDQLGITVICQRRGPGKYSDQRTLYITDNQRVASRGAEKAGVPDELRAEAEKEYREKPEYVADSNNYPDRIYRGKRTRPLLILHLLAIGKKDDDLSAAQPTIAWSISFPTTAKEEQRVQYVVNTTWMREHFPTEQDEEETQEDDE
jgi:hypothetical protein